MDINTFYSQAKAWRDQNEEAERIAARQEEEHMKAEWQELYALARQIYPISGCKVFETQPGQTNTGLKRNQIVALDAVIDQAVAEQVEKGDGRILTGVVRIFFFYNSDEEEWQVLKYSVREENGHLLNFENPYEAFLTAFKPV